MGYMVNNISFMPYGAKINNEIIYKKSYHELLVTVSGPISNIVLALLIISMWWIYPITYNYSSNFVVANLSIGLFNLLPIFPLDGGQFVLGLFRQNRKRVV